MNLLNLGKELNIRVHETNKTHANLNSDTYTRLKVLKLPRIQDKEY